MQKKGKQFYIQKIDTLKKARQFALRFIYKKLDTLQYAICHDIFEAGNFVQKV